MNESLRRPRGAWAGIYLPLAVFLAVSAGAFAVAEERRAARLAELRGGAADAAAAVAEDLQEAAAANILEVRQLRDLEAGGGLRDPATADLLAAGLAARLELAGIARLDPRGALLRVLPASAKLPGQNVMPEEPSTEFFEKARGERADLVSPSMHLSGGGGFGFVGYFPVVRGEVDEVLAAYFRFDELIENAVDDAVLEDFDLLLRDLDERRVVYERWHGDFVRDRELRRSAELRIAGHRYEVQVQPSGALVAAASGGLWRVRLAGLLLAALLAAGAYGLARRGRELRQRDQLIAGLVAGLPLTVFRLDSKGEPIDAEGRAGAGRSGESSVLRRLLAEPGMAAAIAAAAAGRPSRHELQAGAAHYDVWLLPDVVHPGGVAGFAHEVSDRHQSEEALRRSENRYRGFFQEAPFGYLVASAEGRIELANLEAARLFHRGEEQLIGRQLVEIFGTGKGDRLAAAALLERVEQGDEIRDHELRLSRPDGKVLWCRLSVQPVHEDGDYAGGRFVLVDVSRRKELEERLRQTGKLEAVGRFAAGITHDFNNLLTAIMGFARLARGRLSAGSPLERDLGEIEKAGKRAGALVGRLLAFSRQQPAEAQAVDVNARVRDLAAMLRRLVREDIELELRLGDAGSARIDPAQLEQMLVNLVVNAVEAIDGRGHIVIETSTRHATGEEPQSRIRIIDDGRGMAPEVREHLFEPFFTTKAPTGGVDESAAGDLAIASGLGLATVYGIVEQHQGSILVDSEPGLGTTVTVLFPRRAAAERKLAEPTASAAASPHSLPPSGQERVLLVEDEEQVREMAREMLEILGYRVTTARDGRHALELVAGRESEVDLLVSDVIMPHVGGEALFHALKARHPGLKVLFTSGYTDDAFIRKSVEAGELPFLYKPYTLDTLATALRAALGVPLAAPLGAPLPKA